jgi:hypothetical protein
MIYKRLEQGHFFVELSNEKVRINRQQLEWLMLGHEIDPKNLLPQFIDRNLVP